MASVFVTNIWIVEWLFETDARTGQALHDWLNQRRPGWAHYTRCQSKADLLTAITVATKLALQRGMRPILHIETHGCDDGIAGAGSAGKPEFIAWSELNGPLQLLNEATGCNLVIACAACKGFAVVKALAEGPRAPAAAILGPDTTLTGSDLLAGMKELYRRQLDTSPALSTMVGSASNELRGASFEYESFASLAHDSYVQQLIVSLRPEQRELQLSRLRTRLRCETELCNEEIELRLATLPPLPPADTMQDIWDKLFMIDLHPENKDRFGLDVRAVYERLLGELLPMPSVRSVTSDIPVVPYADGSFGGR